MGHCRVRFLLGSKVCLLVIIIIIDGQRKDFYCLHPIRAEVRQSKQYLRCPLHNFSWFAILKYRPVAGLCQYSFVHPGQG